MENLELQNFIQKNFDEIADTLNDIYANFYVNISVNCYASLDSIVNNFSIILNEYIKVDKSFNINLVATSIKNLLTATEKKDIILISDILRFEFQEYLEVMHTYLGEI